MKFRISNWLIICGLSLFFISVNGCQEIPVTDSEGVDTLNGIWVLNSDEGADSYLSIAPDTLIFYTSDIEDLCVVPKKYAVQNIQNRSFYFLNSAESDETLTLAISRNGDQIHVRELDETQEDIDKYTKSDVTPEQLVTGCGSSEEDDGDEEQQQEQGDKEQVFGEWESIANNTAKEFLSITEDSLISYIFDATSFCYEKKGLQILEIRDGTFTAEENGETTFLSVEMNGATLAISSDKQEKVQRYKVSTVDFEMLTPACGSSEEAEPDTSVSDNYNGEWETIKGNVPKTYLEVSGAQINVFSPAGDENCYAMFSGRIIAKSGDDYIIQNVNDESEIMRLIFVSKGNALDVTFEQDGASETLRFKGSKADLNGLNTDCSGDESETDPEPESEVFGKWETFQGNKDQQFISINEELITWHTQSAIGTCFVVASYEILSINGSVFELTGVETDEFIQLEMGVQGNQLVISWIESGERLRLKESAQDFDLLSVDCATAEEPVEGESPIGVWETFQGNLDQQYVLIDDATIQWYTESDGQECYLLDEFEIISMTEEVYTVEHIVTGDVSEFRISFQGKQLTIERQIDGEWKSIKLKESNFEVTALNVNCEVPEEPTPEVFGNWASFQGNTEQQYVAIGESQISWYTETEEGCYTLQEFEVQSINGEEFVVMNVNTSEQLAFQITTQGKQVILEWEEAGSLHSLKLKETSVVFSDLSTDCEAEIIEEPAPEVLGNWETFQGNLEKQYISISESMLTWYSYQEETDCYILESFEVLSVNGDLFEVENLESGDQLQVEITKQGSHINISMMGIGSIKFKASSENFSSLNLDCTEPDVDPDPEPEPSPETGINPEVLGNWETFQGNLEKQYISISESMLTWYSYQEETDCYILESFEVLSVNGDLFEVENLESGDQLQVEITKQGSHINISMMGIGSIKFKASSENFSSLNLDCTEPDVDPDPEPEPSPETGLNPEVLGNWESFQGKVVQQYLSIEEGVITWYFENKNKGCFDFAVLDIIGSDNELVLVQYQITGDQAEFSITKSGNQLTIEWDESGKKVSLKLKESDLLFEELPTCILQKS